MPARGSILFAGFGCQRRQQRSANPARCADASRRRGCAPGGLPVNFHALSYWQIRHGALACNGDEGSMVYHLALRDTRCPALAEGLPDLQRLRSARECAQAQVAELAASLGSSLRPEQAFALLRSCDDAPQLLQALAPVLIEAAPDIQADLLPQWRNALAHACEQYYPALHDDGFFRNAAFLAMNLDAWGLATRLLENSAGLYGATLTVPPQVVRGVRRGER